MDRENESARGKTSGYRLSPGELEEVRREYGPPEESPFDEPAERLENLPDDELITAPRLDEGGRPFPKEPAASLTETATVDRGVRPYNEDHELGPGRES